MLSSEFNQELGALIRSLEQKVRTEPQTWSNDPLVLGASVQDNLDRAIINLIALRLSLNE